MAILDSKYEDITLVRNLLECDTKKFTITSTTGGSVYTRLKAATVFYISTKNFDISKSKFDDILLTDTMINQNEEGFEEKGIETGVSTFT